MYIDTHAHLYDSQFKDNISEIIDRALICKVNEIIIPNCDILTIQPMLEICTKYKDTCYPMLGLHPCDVKEDYMVQLNNIQKYLYETTFVGIGEIGIDLYWSRQFETEQIQAFRHQIQWAIDHNLPIAIHSRESIDMCIGIVNEYKDLGLNGVFHCFTGTIEQAKAVVDMGFYLGIGGVVTYKKSLLPKILENVPMDKVVLETDSPYLPPTPHRGKRNEPSYIPLIAKCLSEIQNCSIEEIAKITTNNAKKLFGFH